MAHKSKTLLGVDEAVLAFIIKYKTDNGGNSPTIREIIESTSVKSTSHATYILDKLSQFGKIRIGSKRNLITVIGYQYTKV